MALLVLLSPMVGDDFTLEAGDAVETDEAQAERMIDDGLARLAEGSPKPRMRLDAASPAIPPVPPKSTSAAASAPDDPPGLVEQLVAAGLSESVADRLRDGLATLDNEPATVAELVQLRKRIGGLEELDHVGRSSAKKIDAVIEKLTG